MTSGAVVVIGSINIDETLPVAGWPSPGETAMLAGPILSGLGGKGANQAVAAALAGADVAFVGAVGGDAGGERALETLAAQGVAVDRIRRADSVPTGRAMILLHPDGENLILVDPGANADVSAADVIEAREAITSADVVLVQGEVAPEVIDAAAALCREVGTRFVLNLAPVVPVADETLAAADPLIVNQSEARHLGIDPEAPIADRVRSLVVTRGAEGVIAVTPDGSFTDPARRVTAVDTTGAGDAFAGTMCASLAAGEDLAAACRAGSAAAAYAVTRPGASASYGTAAEVAAFHREH